MLMVQSLNKVLIKFWWVTFAVKWQIWWVTYFFFKSVQGYKCFLGIFCRFCKLDNPFNEKNAKNSLMGKFGGLRLIEDFTS